ncbi:potassium transporter TrkG, partial [Escherichia coli]
HNVYSSALMTINQAFFQVVSMATTAGFTTDSIARWPLFLPVLLLCSAFIGGCRHRHHLEKRLVNCHQRRTVDIM